MNKKEVALLHEMNHSYILFKHGNDNSDSDRISDISRRTRNGTCRSGVVRTIHATSISDSYFSSNVNRRRSGSDKKSHRRDENIRFVALLKDCAVSCILPPRASIASLLKTFNTFTRSIPKLRHNIQSR